MDFVKFVGHGRRGAFTHLPACRHRLRPRRHGVHIVAVDTETCALGPGRDRIVQFCAIELDGDLREQSRWTELVDPGCHIPAAATAIHGIGDAMVRGKPCFPAFAPRLRGLIGPHTVFMAYNASFDLGVLNLEFARCGVAPIPASQPVLDPLQLERRLTSRSLGPTYRRYTGRDLEGAHTADADAAAMVEVLRRQRQAHAGALPPRVEDLVGWPPRPLVAWRRHVPGRLGGLRPSDENAVSIPR